MLEDIKARAAKKLALSLGALLLPAAILIVLSYKMYVVYVNIYTASTSAAAFISSLTLLRAYAGSPKRVTHPQILLVIGLALWMLAEVLYLGFIVLYGEAPAPSVCDILWLAGYPPLFLWLWSLSKPFYSQLRRLGVSFRKPFMITAFFAALAVATVVSIGVGAREPPSLARAIDSSYTVMNAVLLGLSTLAARAYWKSTLGFAYWLATVGFALLSTADFLYFVANTSSFVPADLLYAASYILITLGLRANIEMLRGSGLGKEW